MKKLFLFSILSAQTLHAQIFFGPDAGMNTSNLKMSGPGTTYKNRHSTNARAGLVVSYNGDKSIIYHAGLGYYGKGSNIFSSHNGQTFSSHLVIHSVQLPVYACIQSRPGRYGRFFLGGGGFLDYQFAGKSYVGTAEGTKLTFGSGTGEIKRMDGGLALEGGYRVNDGVTVRGQFQLGLANLSSVSDQSIKSRSFGITVAYMGKSGVTKEKRAEK